MAGPQSRAGLRRDLLAGLAMVLVGALAAFVVHPLVDVGWLRAAGVVVGVGGVFVVLGTTMPTRTVGTRIWQNDRGGL